MAVDYEKGVRPNVYELMQGGGGSSYVLPPATEETLGGVIIGRGIDVEQDGTISVTAPAPADTYTKSEIDAQQAGQNSRIAANEVSIANVEENVSSIEQDVSDIVQDYPPRITALETSQAAQDTAIASLQTHEQQQDTAISANASAILANTRAIEYIAQDVQDIDNDYAPRIAALETSQTAQDTAISNIETDIDGIEQHQAEQDTNIGNNASAILDLETSQEAQDAAIVSLVSHQEQQDTAISANSSAILDLETDLETLSTTIADDDTLGLVKTDSSKNISTNENGMLQIGGRLGQFSSEEMPDGGLYYPLSIQPEVVWKNSMLITEGTLVSTRSSRIFALAAGINVTLKTAAAAGATRFEVSNTFANRFSCAIARNGYATIQEGTAGTIMVHVTNVYLANDPDKTPLVPYSGATESRNNIVIETDTPLSDTDAVTKLRLYGTMTFDSSFHCGQGNGTGGITGKGKLLQLGQSQLSLDGNSILIGNSIFNNKNRCIIVGADHINHMQGACLTGEGHDTTNGKFVGLAEHGKYSVTSANTAFAIGNGTSNTARSNLFEITNENGATGIVIKSPNRTEFKITVDDAGNLSTTQV